MLVVSFLIPVIPVPVDRSVRWTRPANQLSSIAVGVRQLKEAFVRNVYGHT